MYLLLSPRLSRLGDWGGAAVAIGVSLVTAAATKRLVEDPVRFRSGWARDRRGLVTVAGLALIGVTLWGQFLHQCQARAASTSAS